MPEFECTCLKNGKVGVITRLADIHDYKQGHHARLDFYGCHACHRIYFDTPQSPLTQKHINRGKYSGL